MTNATMGTLSAIRSISSTELLKDFFRRFAPSLRADWSLNRPRLDECLASSLAALTGAASGERASVLSHLNDVCSLAADRRTPSRLKPFAAGIDNPTVQDEIVWTLLHEPRLWMRLVAVARSGEIHARRTEDFTVSPVRQPDNTETGRLVEDISNALMKTRLQGEHAHLEPVFDGERWLYFLSVSKRPTNVQHFDRHGLYTIEWDKTADNFLIEYCPTSGLLRLKSDFGAEVRLVVANLFARHLLGGIANRPGLFNADLSRHVLGEVLPRVAGGVIVGVAKVGLSVSFLSPHGDEDTITLTGEGDTNLSRRMTDCLKAIGKTPESVRVRFVDFKFVVAKGVTVRGTVTAKYRGRIDAKGVHVVCRDRKAHEAITHALKDLVA